VTVVPTPGPTDTPVETAAGRLQRRRPGWLSGVPLALLGVVAVVAGALLLALPAPTLRTVGIISGVTLVAFAAAEAVDLVRYPDRAARADRLIAVAALAGAGAIVLAWPTISQLALLYVVGASAVVLGIAEAAALSMRQSTSRERWLGALSSVVAFVFGIAMLGRPQGSLNAAINLLGVYLIAIGALRLFQAVDTWHRQGRSGVPST
jgi:uncharacterized membrane protein HdeD (DUF308 family)